MFTAAIRELQAGWEDYRAGTKTDKNHPIHQLVLYKFKEIVEEWIPNKDIYLVKGSDGQGNILRTPWIAVMNKDITTSATQGYYAVFLFDEELKTMILEIGFGANQFEKKYGTGKKYFEALDAAVKDMQDSSDYLLSRIAPDVKERIRKDRPSLDTQGDFKLRSYEKCSIYCLIYDLNKLTDDEFYKRDLLEILKLYGFMTGSLLLADVEDYVIDEFESPVLTEDFKAVEFEPRVIKVKSSSVEGGSTSAKRYSKKSDKVGKLGEEFVLKYERKLLTSVGMTELSEKIVWHREEPKNRTPGWDITSFDESGYPKFIEVKSSVKKTISEVDLTPNELAKLNEALESNNYYLYIVTNLLEDPKLEILRNPAKALNEGKLELSVATYSLTLGTKTE